MEECRRAWADAGDVSDTITLINAAGGAEPFGPLFNPDDPSLAAPGDMPAKIAGLLRDTNQPVPPDNGALLRCIFESIAVKCAIVLERVCAVAGITPKRLHIGGGGARNELLSNMLAGATGLHTLAGPLEATSVGNIIIQAKTLGHILSIEEGAKLAARSLDIKTHERSDETGWKKARRRYIDLFED
jgi:rhamnulokinase